MEIILNKEDIEEKFVRSGGKGGQHVNKVSTCVQLKHIPTGVTVKCEATRSQLKNREIALQMLIEKLQKIEDEKKAKYIEQIEKAKRRNRKKPRALKEKILKEKKLNSEKKKLRQKPEQ